LRKESAYKDLLDQVSTEIFSLNTKERGGLEKIIEERYVDNFQIYQNNLFYFLNDKIQDQLIGTYLHMGQDNFRFFIRKFILDRGVSSIIINEVLLSFTDYLKKSFHIHDDKMLESLINIDLIWNGLAAMNNWVVEGSLVYWQGLVENLELDEIKVDFDQEEKLERITIDEQLCIKKMGTRLKHRESSEV